MNFGPKHYVPVLKIKRGEKGALRGLDSALKPAVSPLLEIVERNPAQSASSSMHLEKAFDKLADSVAGYPRWFLDAREIAPDGPNGAEEAFKRAQDLNLAFTPVTGISRVADVKAAAAFKDQGLAIRLSRSELEAGNLSKRISQFVSQHDLTPGLTDLIIDLGPIEDLVPEGARALSTSFLAQVPSPTQWRTLTVSGSSFPKSMGVVAKNSFLVTPRIDWLNWASNLYPPSSGLARIPTYSDCGIQHPSGVEGFNPMMMQVSASIRYATGQGWLLVKGESTRVRSAILQFPELARLLAKGGLKSHFLGEEHCAGCLGVRNCGDGTKGLGSPEVWRRLGTIHHLTVVARDLASLP